MGFTSSFDGKAWTGASGNQIGFAGGLPEIQRQGFVTDPIHGQNVDPNTPRPNALPSPQLGTSTDVLAGDEFLYEGGYEYDGQYGWLLDDIVYPSRDADPGTVGHESALGPALRRGPDPAHEVDVYQENQHAGYGEVFYGDNPLKKDLNAWASSSTPAPNTRVYPSSAREETGNWPEPFNSAIYAQLRPVDQSTERIPMRRPAEDDRPVYRYIAVPAMNQIPNGTRWSPQYQSNVPVQNVKPVPMMPQTPVDPWITQEQSTAGFPDSTDIFGGVTLQ